ncbi:hypothetical protein ABFX02_11G026600 [Erythranthe guttata]
MGRAPCCDKANVKKGPWSTEEDAKLKSYIDTYGTGGNWIALPQKIGLKRCGKSCRLRWLNYLRPNLKHGGFTDEEDNIICSLYISIGSRWSIIAAQLPGRTDNDIKNYWNTRLKKKLLGRRKQSNNNTINNNRASNINNNSIHDQPKDNSHANYDDRSLPNYLMSSSAIERLQLHMHLQNDNDPFSSYNNRSLWPKLSPLQQRMINETLNSINHNQNNILMQQQINSLIFPLNKETTTIGVNTQESGTVGPADGGIVHRGFGESDRVDDDLIINNNNKSTSGFFQTGNYYYNNNNNNNNIQVAADHQFDCFKDEMDGLIKGENAVAWTWPSEFDVNSTSSNSWEDSSSAATMIRHQSEGIYDQDFGMGYI